MTIRAFPQDGKMKTPEFEAYKPSAPDDVKGKVQDLASSVMLKVEETASDVSNKAQEWAGNVADKAQVRETPQSISLARLRMGLLRHRGLHDAPVAVAVA